LNKIVQLTVVKQQREASQEALWQRFAELSERSKQTLDINDGIAAGKAYREFCESFLTKRAG
jgi:FixJ family two-component response regulator